MAWIALVVSGLTLLWHIAALLICWPRLSVQLRQHVILSPAPAVVKLNPDDTETTDKASEPATGNKDRFDIVVVNSGAEATTVVDVGIQPVGGSNGIDVQQERDKGTKIEGPDLPARIEEHGALAWVIEPQLTSRFPRGTKLIGYMHKYRRYHKYPTSRRTMIKVYESVHHFTKKKLTRRWPMSHHTVTGRKVYGATVQQHDWTLNHQST